MGPVAHDRRIEGEGTAEAAWQGWPGLQDVTSCTLAEIVPPGHRAVIVAPHPDDEVLAFGGLLALLAAAGQDVLVVAVTNGDASHPGSAQWPAARLAARRIEESLEGLRRLHAAPTRRVGFGIPDGAVAAHADRLSTQLGDIVRPGDVLLSTWSLDGHPDHEACGDVAAQVSAQRGLCHVQAPVWMWHWARPGDTRVPWQNLRRLPLPEPVWRRKVHAIGAHATQLTAQDTGAGAVLTASCLARLLRRHEYFLAGDDVR